MKTVKTMFKSLGLAMAIATISASAGAATAQLAGPANPVLVGESFAITLRGMGFESLDGGGVDLRFAPSQLELISVQIDASWDFFSAPGAIDNVAGSLSDMSFNVWGAKQGNFDIATLQFKAKSSGLASIELLDSVNFPFAAAGQQLAVNLMGMQVQISAVPEPGAWLLLLGGLAVLGSRTLKRKSAIG